MTLYLSPIERLDLPLFVVWSASCALGMLRAPAGWRAEMVARGWMGVA